MVQNGWPGLTRGLGPFFYHCSYWWWKLRRITLPGQPLPTQPLEDTIPPSWWPPYPHFCLGMLRGRIPGATKPGRHSSSAIPEAGVDHPQTQGTAQAPCAPSSSASPIRAHYPDKKLRHQEGKGTGRIPQSPGTCFLICGRRAHGRHHRADGPARRRAGEEDGHLVTICPLIIN